MNTRKLVSWALVASAAAVGVAADRATAVTTASDPYVQVRATSGSLSGLYNVPIGDVFVFTDVDQDIFFWQAPSAVPILDGSTVVATLVSMTVLAGRNTLPSGEVRYGIDIDYQVVAGSGGSGSLPTTFELFSPTLFFDTILNATALTSGTFGGTDQNNDGITLTPGLPGGFAYTTTYDASTFQSLFDSALSNVSGGSVGVGGPANPSFLPIGTASSMQAKLKFTVTAGDSAGGTSTYSIAPAPGAAALLGLGGLLVGRRRR